MSGADHTGEHALDEHAVEEPDTGERYARPIDGFRAGAVGSVLAAGLIGVRDALEGPRDEEVQIVVDHAGDPPFTEPIVLRLDPENPADSIVMIRPWLMGDRDR